MFPLANRVTERRAADVVLAMMAGLRAAAGRMFPSRAGRQPQLLVDVSILWQRDAGTGIQRVVKALGDRLIQAGAGGYDVRFVAATRRKPYRYLTGGVPGGQPRPRVAGHVRAGRGDIFLGLDLCSRILPRHEAQVRRWRARGARIAIVIYDLLPARHPEWFGDKQATHFGQWLHFIRRCADQALCISATVAQDLAAWLDEQTGARSEGGPGDNRVAIAAFPLGGDLRQARGGGDPTPAEAAAAAALAMRRFVLMVGTIEPRKGHAVALDAFDRIIAERAQDAPALVIVGRSGWNADDVEQRIRSHAALGRSLFWFDDASDALLDALYKACLGVFFPTFAEGFGLPVAEAIAHDRPVLARDLPVFRELESDHLRYFSDDSAPALAQSLMTWMENIEKTSKPCQQDIPTWEKSCEVLLRHLNIST